MSTEERQKLIGKAVEDYTANKNELAALKGKAEEMRGALYQIAQYLANFGGNDVETKQAYTDLSKLPSQEEIGTLIKDITEAKAKRQNLRQMLKDAGMELKD